jgi:hypothetical protein
MTVARRKGDPGKADMLFSRIVRSRGTCERCGLQATDTAHIVPRRYSATRCIEDNAWALCRSCHAATGENQREFMALVRATIGEERHDELWQEAYAGKGGALFWAGEAARMTARAKELGIDTRWKVPA